MKQKLLSVLLVLTMVLALLPGMAAAAGEYSDVGSGSWYESAVAYVTANNLMQGVGDGRFDPDGLFNRAQFVTVLHRLEGEPGAPYAGFSDVAPGQYYAAAVDWAFSKGVVNGYGSTFGPDDPLTREQLAAMLYRYASLKDYDLSATDGLTRFPDYYTVSFYAREAMAWAVAEGLVSGSEGRLDPQGGANRAQSAAVLMRFRENVVIPAVSGGGSTGGSNSGSTFVPSIDSSHDPEKTGGSSGGGGGGGGGGVSGGGTTTSDPYALSRANVLINGRSSSRRTVSVREELSVSVMPSAASYSVVWHVGDDEVPGDTYEVVEKDTGKSIYAEVTGTGSYSGTVNSPVLGVDTLVVTSNNNSQAFVDPDADFLNYRGELVRVNRNSELVLTVNTRLLNPDVYPDKMRALNNKLLTFAPDADLSETDITYVAVEADMALVTASVNDALGLVYRDEIEIHPVGTTTLTVSKADLGLSRVNDISKYTFVANHTNARPREESVVGAVVGSGSDQKVCFMLNGLSTVWVGYVPPLTVDFDTQGGSRISSQKVKFGGTAAKVDDPVREGWTFAGWTPDIRTTPIVRDTTFVAEWTQKDAGPDTPLTGDGTPSKTEEVSVDRGFGRYDVRLTGGTDKDGEAVEDYCADIYGYLSRNQTGYYLDLSANLYGLEYGHWDDETESYQPEIYDATMYDTIRAVVTPFEGESFTSVPTVSAYYTTDWENQTEVSVDAELEEGNLVLTCDVPDVDDDYQANLYITLSSGGKEQTVSVYLVYGQEEYVAPKSFDTWAEAVAELARGTARVAYAGSEDATVSDELTIGRDQSLYIYEAPLVVEQGGKLTVGGYLEAREIELDGSVSVSAGGRLYVGDSMTVGEAGSFTTAGDFADIYGGLVNHGTIAVNGGILYLMKTGYSVTNDGKITVASGADIYLEGTLLVNTGTISGSGTLYLSRRSSTSDYDSGIERVQSEAYRPSDYSRGQFVRDPGRTATASYFDGTLDNRDGGTCTVTVRKTF